MKSLYIDCPTGIAGDMLLAAFLDLGVPQRIIENAISLLGFDKSHNLIVESSNTLGLRGLRFSVDFNQSISTPKDWQSIQEFILNSKLDIDLKERVLDVFKLFAEVESSVHGKKIEDVHFHELASFSSLINILGVCAAIQYLNPEKIYCSIPPVGHGVVHTAHGSLPVPVPAVVEIAKRHKIKLYGGAGFPSGELTTPTGIALIALFVDSFTQPYLIDIKRIGIGLGHKSFDRPNFLRICEIDDALETNEVHSMQCMNGNQVVIQESWIDDSTPEDLAALIDRFRKSGAIDVISYPVQMKKGRQGIKVEVMVSTEKAQEMRLIWLSSSTSIGIRERIDSRWVLPRRMGTCITPLGQLPVKQVKRPDGRLTIKAEHDELLKLSKLSGLSIEEIRGMFIKTADSFKPETEWEY